MRRWRKLALINAELVDAWRVFPRMFVCTYGLFVFQVSDWYMSLTSPNNSQAAFAGAVVGISGPILNWYMKTGRNWSEKGVDDDADVGMDRSRRSGGGSRVPGDQEQGASRGASGTFVPDDAADFPGERPARPRVGQQE